MKNEEAIERLEIRQSRLRDFGSSEDVEAIDVAIAAIKSQSHLLEAHKEILKTINRSATIKTMHEQVYRIAMAAVTQAGRSERT